MIKIRKTMAAWHGRIDSNTDYDAFRWHQWVKFLDLNDDLAMASVKVNEADLNIGFIGFPSDEGIKRNQGRIGAKMGPEKIRRELSNLPCWFKPTVRLYDCGDIEINEGNLSHSQKCLSDAIALMTASGIFPIVLGGGHELAYGHYNGLNTKYADLSIFNFDAHFDLRPYDDITSSGTMFRQIADENERINRPFLYYAYGIQKRGNTIALFKEAIKRNADFTLALEINHETDDAIGLKIDQFINKSQRIYATLCTDVIASAYAPGVSAAQPLGLAPEKIIQTLKQLIKSKKVVGFDVAEVSPRYDVDNSTANLVSTIIFACVNALAENCNAAYSDDFFNH